jgi:Amt family ammonium transporter
MAENVTATEGKLIVAVDTSYLLLTGMNILIMQAGFTALEAGGSRAKNVKSLLFKNFMDHAVGSLAWFTIGWPLFIGTDPFAAGPTVTWFVHPLTDYARLFQQFAFAATSATIVSGAVTGRCRLEPYTVLAAFMSGISYPIAAHWAWSDGGFLRALGFLDFAGKLTI